MFFFHIHIGTVLSSISTEQRSKRHQELEKKLENNKKTILNLLKQDSKQNVTLMINQLRNETIHLIHDLTTEIQTERKQFFYNQSANGKASSK